MALHVFDGRCVIFNFLKTTPCFQRRATLHVCYQYGNGRFDRPWVRCCILFRLRTQFFFSTQFQMHLRHRTAEEKRLLVTNIKKAIKGSMKSGTSLAAAPKAKSHSFRRADPLNTSDPSPFLRVDPVMVLRRSFSHNPEETHARRSNLQSKTPSSAEHDQAVDTKRGSPPAPRKISLNKKTKSVAPYVVLDNGLIQL